MSGAIAAIPRSAKPGYAAPAVRAAVIADKAARAAASLSATAALVPGPLGLISLLPEIVAVWKVQAQMVADIAAIYGETASPSRGQMLYCLFRHLASHGVRNVAVRTGDKALVRKAALTLLLRLSASIGVQLGERVAARLIACYAPLVGAAGVGAYTFDDTQRVARTAIDLFAASLVVDVDAIFVDQ